MKSTFATAAMIASSLPLAAQIDSKPNIIIFLVDDMGLMDTSVEFMTSNDGELQSFPLNDWYRTPSMERLASKGIRFSRFYA